MEDLRLAIIIIGVFAIVGILLHGMWTIRKNKTQDADSQENASQTADTRSSDEFADISLDDPLLQQSDFATEANEENAIPTAPIDTPDEEIDPLIGDTPIIQNDDLKVAPKPEEKFDQDGIGSVRVVSIKEEIRHPVTTEKTKQEAAQQSEQQPENEPRLGDMPEPPSSLMKADKPEPMIDISIDVDSPKAKQVAKEAPAKSDKPDSLSARARKLVGRDAAKTKAGKNQISLELDDAPDLEASSSAEVQPEQPEVEQEVLILSVRVSEGQSIGGARLLPTLLTLGFKYGEHNMFHRHANSNGKGPKLFTLANMYNPGTFDIDNMDHFNTQGLSLFMTLPIEADPHQVFNMMHNAARKLAEEFSGQVLDSRRSVLTKQSLQQYVEKIREFERRRMIRR